jgi:hypothetical protein
VAVKKVIQEVVLKTVADLMTEEAVVTEEVVGKVETEDVVVAARVVETAVVARAEEDN